MGDARYDRHYRESDAACGPPFDDIVAFVQAEVHRGTTVLDLGCGQGRDSLLFARAGATVWGVDVSSVGVEQLRATARAEGLALRASVADIRHWRIPSTYDVVVLDRVLHMLGSDEERREVLQRAVDAVRPGGHLLVADGPSHRAPIRDQMLAAGFALTRDRPNRTFGRRPVPTQTPAQILAVEADDEGLLDGLVALERALVASGRGQVSGPDDVADEERLRDRLRPDASTVRRVAVIDGRVVASAGLHRFRPQLVRHVASLDLGVHPSVQGRGLGRALMEVLIGVAADQGVERLELCVRSDNLAAIGLYRSLGFDHEATRRGLVRTLDGRVVDDHFMVRWLSP